MFFLLASSSNTLTCNTATHDTLRSWSFLWLQGYDAVPATTALRCRTRQLLQ